MKSIVLSVITASTLLAGVCANASPTYDVVAPGSAAIDARGLQDAPYHDADNIARNGMGSDAIAFRFDAAGRLVGRPAYISAQPESFYASRLAALSSRGTTLANVRAVFDTTDLHVEKRGADTLAYVEVPVYDPLASGE